MIYTVRHSYLMGVGIEERNPASLYNTLPMQPPVAYK